MMIAELLYKMGIPFAYEKKLYLYDEDGNLKVVYPDFTVFIGEDGAEEFYIEHLGLLTEAEYCARSAEKLSLYHRNKILMPGKLIFTMDGPGGGFDAGPLKEYLEQVILLRFEAGLSA